MTITLEKPTLPFLGMAKSLLRECSDLHFMLFSHEQVIKLKTIGNIPEDEEKGDHYEAHILTYIHKLKDLQLQFTPRITRLGETVTECIRTGFDSLSEHEAEIFRENALLAYATAMEPLGARPSKKVCTVLVAPDHRILGWDVNRLCPGLEQRPEYYIKSEHGHRAVPIWCSERTVLLSRYGLAATPPVDDTRQALQASVDELTGRLVKAALNDTALKDVTFAVTLPPCNRCTDVMAPVHGHGRIAAVGQVIALENHLLNAALKHPERNTAGSTSELIKAGILVHLRELAQLPQP